ncbi:MAG: hypothetical protein KA051_02265 [Paludibacteraceae bacterium]|nr:hypothetical protein [Paludibacteraceae bacterium]
MEQILNGYKITITRSDKATDVIVYCNSYGDGTEAILKSVKEIGCSAFHFVVISKIHWDADMSPWPADKVISKQDKFKGNANHFLDWEQTMLIPAIEGHCQGQSLKRILLGYSLSGLFATYAMYCTDKFAAYVSASGSLWYPGFEKFALNNEPMTDAPIYLSIGDKEKMSKNAYLQSTEGITRHLYEHYKSKGRITHFDLNPGNHFVGNGLRQAKGIKWTMENI